MSKQSDAKNRQGYTDKAVPRQCSTCKEFSCEQVQTVEPTIWNPSGVWEEKKMRCSIGGFAVKKTAVCDLHSWAK